MAGRTNPKPDRMLMGGRVGLLGERQRASLQNIGGRAGRCESTIVDLA